LLQLAFKDLVGFGGDRNKEDDHTKKLGLVAWLIKRNSIYSGKIIIIIMGFKNTLSHSQSECEESQVWESRVVAGRHEYT